MKVSTIMTHDEGTRAEVQVKFWEGNKNLHTLTVFVDDPESQDGSIGIMLSALRKAQEILPQIQEVILEALKPENDPRL